MLAIRTIYCQILLFLKTNKIENGQKRSISTAMQVGPELKPVSNLLNNANILAQLNLIDKGKQHTNPNDVTNFAVCNSDSDAVNSLEVSFSSGNMQNQSQPFKVEDECPTDEFPANPVNLHNKSQQDLLISDNTNLTSESVPTDFKCSDLSSEQRILHRQCHELLKRTRRVQIQHTHRNLTKQMKQFVSRQQKLNSVNCQRFNFDFSRFINLSTDNSSQLKANLLQKDAALSKSDKLIKPDHNSTTFFTSSQPNRNSTSSSVE